MQYFSYSLLKILIFPPKDFMAQKSPPPHTHTFCMSQEEKNKCSWQSYLCSIFNIFNHTGSPQDKQTLSQIKTHFKTFLICKILKLNLQKFNPNIQKGIVPFLKLHWSTIAHKARRSCWCCQPFSEDGQTLSQIDTHFNMFLIYVKYRS